MVSLKRETQQVLLGVGIGAAALTVVPALWPAVSAATRPFFKTILTRVWLAGLRVREHVAVMGESLDDLFAEVHADVKAELERRTERGAAVRGAGNGSSRASRPNGPLSDPSTGGGGAS